MGEPTTAATPKAPKKERNPNWGAKSHMIDAALQEGKAPVAIATEVAAAFPGDLKKIKQLVYLRKSKLKKKAAAPASSTAA